MSDIDPRYYELYTAGLQPQKLGWAIIPARKVLRRLMAATTEVEMRFFTQLDRDIADLRARMDRLGGGEGEDSLPGLAANVRRLDRRLEDGMAKLRADYYQLSGMFWDREALARRLATLEDTVARLQAEVAHLREAEPAREAAGVEEVR